jgi:CHAD domain-containing protein
MLAEGRQMMTANRTAIRRRLAIGRKPHRPPWGARKAGHSSIVAPLAATLAATVAVGIGVGISRGGRNRKIGRREPDHRLGLLAGERASEGIRRMTLAQLDLAIELLGSAEGGAPKERSVHEIRKAIKRLRALMRLLRGELGEKAYAREDRALRDAGRALAGARDAEVMLATLDDLIARDPSRLAGRKGVRRLRERLEGERERARRAMGEDPRTRTAALDSLRGCRARIAAWDLPHRGGVRLLEPGLREVYRQGRARHRHAARRGGTDLRRMHEWRKRVKDLRYASEAIDSRQTRGGGLARRADELAEVLGEDHDLGLLDAWLREQRRGGRRSVRRSAKALRRTISRRRRRLQRRALRKGERLYRARPKKFMRGRSRASGS